MSPLPEHDQPQLTMTQNDTLHFMAPPVPTNSSPTISTVGVASSSSPSHPPLLRTASEDMRLNSPLSQPLVPLLSSDRPVYGLIIDEVRVHMYIPALMRACVHVRASLCVIVRLYVYFNVSWIEYEIAHIILTDNAI